MELFKNLGKTKLAIIGVSGLVSLLAIGLLVFKLAKPTLVPLYSDLSQEDTSLVLSRLQAMGKSFSTVVTYESRHYLHFTIKETSIVLFKFG